MGLLTFVWVAVASLRLVGLPPFRRLPLEMPFLFLNGVIRSQSLFLSARLRSAANVPLRLSAPSLRWARGCRLLFFVGSLALGGKRAAAVSAPSLRWAAAGGQTASVCLQTCNHPCPLLSVKSVSVRHGRSTDHACTHHVDLHHAGAKGIKKRRGLFLRFWIF